MCTYYAKKRRNGTQLLVRMGTGVKSIRDSDVIGTANNLSIRHCVVPYSVTTWSWAHPRLLYHSASTRTASQFSIHLQLVFQLVTNAISVMNIPLGY